MTPQATPTPQSSHPARSGHRAVCRALVCVALLGGFAGTAMAPTASINAAGTQLSGQAEPGATVTATLPDGTELTATADANGDYSIALSPALTNGEAVQVSASDAAGNASLPTDVSAPDSTDPIAPTASVAPNGSAVTGTAEPGATVTAYDESGKPLGSATADANGNYSIPLSPALTDGQTLDVVAEDAAGNASATTEASAPDSTAPTIAISSNQASLAAGQTATITFTLSEASADFAWDGSTGDITVSGGSLSALTQSSTDPKVYTATFTPNANSNAAGVISVASGQFSDAAGNTNSDGAEDNNTVTLTVNTNASPSTALSLTPDTATLGEAAGTNNGTPGAALASSTAGVAGLNVLGNDQGAAALSVSAVNGQAGQVGSAVVGLYGQLTLNADGSYSYQLSENNATVQGLLSSTNTLVDVFTYTATDGTSSAVSTLSITVIGANDAPGVNTPLADTSTSVGGNLAYTFDSATFKDIDTGDSLGYTVQQVDASGNLVNGGTLPTWLQFNPVTRTFSGNPDTSGDVYVRVTATDLGGLSASDDFKIAVAATNKLATIDITSIVDSATDSQDSGTSASDFVTSDRTLSFQGSVTGWTAGLGDQVKLELYTEPGGTLVGSATTITPAADGSWSWDHSATPLEANAQYKLRATLVDSNGNPVSLLVPSTVAGNLTGGVYDEQIVTIDNTATNTDVNLSVKISTDADDNTHVSTAELAGASTFTAEASFDTTQAKAGDIITFTAANGATALTSQSVTLTAADVSAGKVSVNFAVPTGSDVQTVQVNYTDLAGNVATDSTSAQLQDSASLDETTPTIEVTSDKTTLKKGETAELTFTLSEASTDFMEGDVAITGGALSNWVQVSPTVYTATFTPSDNVNLGSATISVASDAFADAAGNKNADGAEADNKVDITWDTAAPTTSAPWPTTASPPPACGATLAWRASGITKAPPPSAPPPTRSTTTAPPTHKCWSTCPSTSTRCAAPPSPPSATTPVPAPPTSSPATTP